MKRVYRKICRKIAAVFLIAAMLLQTGVGVSAASVLQKHFAANYYSSRYADVNRVFGSNGKALYQHWIRYGLNEGRCGIPFLDLAAYREKNKDLQKHFGNNWNAYLNHYLKYGVKEDRPSGIAEFDARSYADRYADLKAAFGYDAVKLYQHWIQYGKAEGRYAGRKTLMGGNDRMQEDGNAEEDSAGNLTPDTPDVPENPNQPDTPDQPENPDVPENPDQPENPDTPENPGEPVSESGYYLVWEDFTNPYPNAWSNTVPSSWDGQLPAGKMQYTTKENIKTASLVDNSIYTDAILQRKFNTVSGIVDWEFSLNATGDVNGSQVSMRSGEKTAIRFMLENGQLKAGETVLADVPGEGESAGIKVTLDTQNGTYCVSINGQKNPQTFAFEESCGYVDCMYIATTQAAVGTIGLSFVRIYQNLYVNEKFLSSTQALPDDWDKEGTANVVKKMGSVAPDLYSLKFTDESTQDSSAISRQVSYRNDEAWVEYQFMVPEENGTDLFMTLTGQANEDFRVGTFTADGKRSFGYIKEGTLVPLYEILTDQWYHVLVKLTKNGTAVSLNHKLLTEDTDQELFKIREMKFATDGEGTGEVYLDDILLKDYVEYPENYVPEPILPEEDDYLVGMQSCSLWKEGSHFGWDWISDWDERKSYLGLYDEMNPEAADWEIKWMLEHSIDYNMFCWYRPPVSQNEPIKQPRNAYGLEEAFFNAKYSDQMKFAISWENSSSDAVADGADFRENIVTYWLEQYFKDDRYLLIGNKPVVGIYNFANLVSKFGSVAAVKEEMDYLKNACVEAGFDGCIVMLTSNSFAADTLKEYADAGIDCLYAYSWGPDTEVQKNNMTSQRDTGLIDVVPTICMGKDASAWNNASGTILSSAQVEELAQWTKDSFMSGASSDSLGAKMVMIGNWNEYGEGHYMIPSNREGFAYVDVIRKIFGDGRTHEDVRPDADQLARIQKMYIQNRRVPKAYAKEAGTEIPQTVKLGWYFEEDGNTEGFTVNKQIDNLTAQNGALTGTSTGNDPGVLSVENLNLAAGNIPYIRLRLKTDCAANVMLYFITASDPAWKQNKCFSKMPIAAGEDYTEFLIDTSTKPAWTGTIKQIRLDPLDCKGNFAVDSIELLQADTDSEAAVFFEGEEIFTRRPVLIRDEQVMFPVAELSESVNMTWTNSLVGDRLLMLFEDGNCIQLAYGQAQASLNGEALEVPAGAMVIEGQYYFPIKSVLEAAGFHVEWDAETKILSVTTKGTDPVDPTDPTEPTEPEEPDEPPMDVPPLEEGLEVKYGWYFDETREDWELTGGNLVWKNGTIRAACDAEPKLYSKDELGIDLTGITQVRVRVKLDQLKGKCKLYFTTDQDTTMDEKKAVKVAYEGLTPGSDGYYTITMDCSANAKWTGVLKQLRITPSSYPPVNISIDSVELIGAKAE